jgi:hypothetical protein
MAEAPFAPVTPAEAAFAAATVAVVTGGTGAETGFTLRLGDFRGLERSGFALEARRLRLDAATVAVAVTRAAALVAFLAAA